MLKLNKFLAGAAILTFLGAANLFPALADNRTSSVFNTTTSSATQVFPYLSVTGNQNVIVLDLQRDNFKNVEYIHYNLNYNTSDPGTQRGAEGTYYPWLPNIKAQLLYWQGKPFFRQYIPLGTCSHGVCKYDQNPTSFKVMVYTKYFGKAATDNTVITVNR